MFVLSAIGRKIREADVESVLEDRVLCHLRYEGRATSLKLSMGLGASRMGLVKILRALEMETLVRAIEIQEESVEEEVTLYESVTGPVIWELTRLGGLYVDFYQHKLHS